MYISFFNNSTLMRRVPDPDSPRWAHMALYLQSREPSTPGRWMEDYSFLAAYKLKASVRVHNSLYQFVVLALHPNLCWKKYIGSTEVVVALVMFLSWDVCLMIPFVWFL